MLYREMESKVKEQGASLEQIATTGTTMEVVQNKVSDMATKGLIQAYAIADGTLEGIKLKDNTITNNKINGGIELNKIKNTKIDNTINLFDVEKATAGVHSISTGKFTSGKYTWNGYTYEQYTSDFIECKANDIFSKNTLQKGTEVTFWNSNKEFVVGQHFYSNKITVPNNENIKYMKVTVLVYSSEPSCLRFMRKLDEFMVVKGETLPNDYIPCKKNYIDYLEPINKMARPVIFDTDWAYDTDDIIASRILIWAERTGMIDIVSLIISLSVAKTAPSLDAFFTYEGRPGLCIGADKTYSNLEWDTGVWHNNMIKFPHSYNHTSECEDAIRTYRRSLVNAKKSVDVIIVGPPICFSNLLKSQADDISDLSGYELVAKKVRKVWCMGGKYPTGSEANFNANYRGREHANYFVDNCPVPITFLGFEVGDTVKTGGNLIENREFDPAGQALYETNRTNGGSSWDPMLTLLACLDDYDQAGYSVVKGTNHVDATDGSNNFTTDNVGHHEYVVKNHPDAWYKNEINKILERNGWTTRKLGEQQLTKI